MGYSHTKVSKCFSFKVNFLQVDCRASSTFPLWAYCIPLHEACFFFLIIIMNWFKHLVHSTSDPDLMESETKFKCAGPYVFWRTIEILAREDILKESEPLVMDFKTFSLWYPSVSKNKLKEILTFFGTKRTNFDKVPRIICSFFEKNISIYCDKLSTISSDYTRKVRSMSGQWQKNVQPDIEVEEDKELDKDKKKNYKKEKVEITWRNSFEKYLEITNKAIKELLKDEKELKQQQEFQPNLNIPLTLKKAYKNFWGKEAGWKNKKKSRTKDIDMRMTFINAISQKINKVYKTEEDQQEGLAV